MGPASAVLLYLLMRSFSWDHEASFTASLTLLCAFWWVSEAVPIPVTSLIPLALLPFAGVLTPNQVAEAYGSPLILLLLGGFILSTAMEKSNAHRQIALRMVSLMGASSHRRIVFGFMLASAVLSMWISNTATTLMLLPIALAVLQSNQDSRFAVALLLGICYSASVGGIGTPIGTPPNLVFMKVYSENTGEELTFLGWMKIAVPVVVLFIPVIGFWLTRHLGGGGKFSLPAREPWTSEQIRVLTIFLLTAVAWVTRKEPFGGWSHALSLPGANDASVALIAVIAMFIVPNGKGGRLLNWETANKIPWGILFLFAGGIAIAKAFGISGLAEGLAKNLHYLTVMPGFVMILLICIAVTFMTELTSNTATTTLLMPILAVVGVAADLDPALLMLPAAMSASCAFMLPVATAPNAIIFGSGRVSIRQMAGTGLILNFLGIAVVSLSCFLFLS